MFIVAVVLCLVVFVKGSVLVVVGSAGWFGVCASVGGEAGAELSMEAVFKSVLIFSFSATSFLFRASALDSWSPRSFAHPHTSIHS